ncbi:hypothetical protein D3C79_627340 [compost metagenome]
MVELVLLSLGQGVIGLAEIATGVRHVRIQPQLVERVGQVVVVGNGVGVGVFVMGFTQRCDIVLTHRQCFAEFIADADDLADITFQLQLAFDEGLTQIIEAGVSQLGDQLGFLDQDSDLRARPQIEVVAVPQLETQRQVQALQRRWKLRKHR